jgi:hypothetical protein
LNEEDRHKSHSINEAIVSAQAREASAKHKSSTASLTTDKMQLEWLEKQKQLEEEIEQRALEKARERMQLELIAMQEQMKRQAEERQRQEEEERRKLLVFEEWKSNVEREKQQQQQQQQHKEQGRHQAEEAALVAEDSAAHTEKDSEPHPILGRQLANLSYKRIHLMSATTLASLPVYEKQRAYRHDRAQLMAKDKKKTLWMGIPGVISLMEDESGKLAILDGQHRVGMMALLREEQQTVKEGELAQLDLQNILVEVFRERPRDDSVLANEKDLDDKAAIFTEINKAEPIKLLDLPGVATKQTRNIIDHAGT